MKVELARSGGPNGKLVLRIVAETPSDHVALREFAAPLPNASGPANAELWIDRASAPQDALDLGPVSVGVYLKEPSGG